MGHARMFLSSGFTPMNLCRRSSSTWRNNMRGCPVSSSPNLTPSLQLETFRPAEKPRGYGRIIPECIRFDWFHIFLVHGIANREFALLFGALVQVGLSGRLETILASFEWPKQFQVSTPNKIFGKRDSSIEPLKCSASEM